MSEIPRKQSSQSQPSLASPADSEAADEKSSSPLEVLMMQSARGSEKNNKSIRTVPRFVNKKRSPAPAFASTGVLTRHVRSNLEHLFTSSRKNCRCSRGLSLSATFRAFQQKRTGTAAQGHDTSTAPMHYTFTAPLIIRIHSVLVRRRLVHSGTSCTIRIPQGEGHSRRSRKVSSVHDVAGVLDSTKFTTVHASLKWLEVKRRAAMVAFRGADVASPPEDVFSGGQCNFSPGGTHGRSIAHNTERTRP